jgi:flagellar hook-basal body complex protein FliE
MITPITTQGVASTGLSRAGGSARSQAIASGPAFGQALEKALKAVSQSQADASNAQMSVQLEKHGASIEQAMVSMQKANVAFTAAVTVRNKMVSAYSEIMNMQV